MDITNQFIQASRSGLGWTEQHTWQAFETSRSAIGNADIDWYPESGEAWGRLIYDKKAILYIYIERCRSRLLRPRISK